MHEAKVNLNYPLPHLARLCVAGDDGRKAAARINVRECVRWDDTLKVRALTFMSLNTQIRDSALGLLADGNSPEAVASMLGMPLTDLNKLRAAGAEMNTGMIDGTASSHARANVRSLEFASELVYRAPSSIRFMFAASGVFLLALLAFLWSGSRLPRPGPNFALPSLFLSAGASWMILNARTRFIFGKFGVVDRGALFARKLKYSEIAAIHCGRGVEHDRGGAFPGYQFDFVPNNAFSPKLSLFVRDTQPLAYEVRVRLRQLFEVLGSGSLPL